MRHTIHSRITSILFTAICFIALIGALSLYYLSKLSGDIDQIIKKDIIVERSIRGIKDIHHELKRAEKVYLENLKNGEPPIDIEIIITSLKDAVVAHGDLPLAEKGKEFVKEFTPLIDEYSTFIEKAQSQQQPVSDIDIKSLEKNSSKITDKMKMISDQLLADRHQKLKEHQEEVELLISNAHRNMLLFLFVVFSGGMLLIILAPRHVTAPFRRYIAAINEVESLKFDTRLPIVGDDEVANLGKAINRLIERFCTFDEIKQKRIQFEKSKQRVLANMLDLGVMMVAIEGDILFLNAQLAKMLDLNTEDYHEKDYHHVDLPEELKEMITEALKTKERIDSRMMIFYYKVKNEKDKKAVEVLVDIGLVRSYQGNVVNLIITFEDITNPAGQSVFKRISLSEQALI